MTDGTRSLLVVEDNPGDVDLIRAYLEEADADYAVSDASRLEDALARFHNGGLPDAVLLDLGLPDCQGIDTLRRLLSVAGDVPVIVLTGNDDRALAVRALQEGARDFLVKGGLDTDSLTRAVNAAIDRVDNERLRRRIRAKLSASEERFRTAFDTAPHGMALIAPDGLFLKANPSFCGLLGYGEDELFEMDVQAVTHPDDRDIDLAERARLLSGEIASFQMEKRYVRKDGATVTGQLSVSLVRTADGSPLHFVSQVFDLTERRELEQRLRQAQRMEAVGQLTGGIAHDFNNLLGVIVGNLELLERPVSADPRAQKRVKAALFAAERGAELTRQLLAFSRRQALEAEVVNVNALIDEMAGMLRRTLGEAVVLAVQHNAALWPTRIDPVQFEAAILNLTLNARDAMPSGGHLTIETDNIKLDGNYAASEQELEPGDYVLVAVSDNGTGIPPDTLARVFEPFFTTKETGKGSGLGLSMVFGYVKQSGGHVKIYSEPGHGTTVKLYMPRVDGEADGVKPAGMADAPPAQQGSGATILLVEDKDDLREIAVEMLEDLGYRLLSAADGPSALALIEEHASIDLLLTDIVMPGGMTGPQLARAATAVRPDLRVLFMSGYAESAVLREGQVAFDTDLIGKPFRRAELARRVRAALGEDD